MSHHKTLNTRLLPLSILISSLVSGGAAATAISTPNNISTSGTTEVIDNLQRVANGGSILISDDSSTDGDNTPADAAAKEKSIFEQLDDFLNAGFINQKQKETLEVLGQKRKDVEEAKAEFELATQAKENATRIYNEKMAEKEGAEAKVTEKEQAIKTLTQDLATKNDVKDKAVVLLTLNSSSDKDIATQVTDLIKTSGDDLKTLQNSLASLTEQVEKTKDAKEKHEADLLKFTNKISTLEESLEAAKDNKTDGKTVLDKKLADAKKNKETAENDADSELAKAQKKHDDTKANLESEDTSLKTTAGANLADYNEAAKSFDEAIKTADQAVKDKEKEIEELENDKQELESKKTAAVKNTAQIVKNAKEAAEAKDTAENKITEINETLTKATAANTAIKKAAAAQEALTTAEGDKNKFTESVNSLQQEFDAAAETKSNAENDLPTKEDLLTQAKTAVEELESNTSATELPVVNQTISQGESKTVDADSVAINTNVAGGTQDVAKNGKIIGSMVSEDGAVNLIAGAKAHNTVVAQGTINNNGGNDYDSVINNGGKLILTGTTTTDGNGNDVTNIAKSHKAQINTGGIAEVGKDSEIHHLTSTGGTVALTNGAQAFDTTIDGGKFTIDKATAERTSLTNATLELADDKAIANKTTVNKDASFNLKSNAATSGTIIKEGGSFTLGDDSSAEGTIVYDGTVTVKDKANISNTELNGAKATLKLGSGTKATGTKLTDATLELTDGVTAEDTQLHGFSHFNLGDNTTAKNTVINSDSEFSVSQNATADTTTLHSGKFSVIGAATNTTVNRGEFTVSGTGTANDTTVTGGKFAVYEKATATATTLNGGDFSVDGTANNTTVAGGKFALNKDATANTTTLNGGDFIVDGTAKDTMVKGGKFALNKGATANTTTLDSGDFIVNGTANNTMVKGGKFNLMARAQAHKLTVEEGNAQISGDVKDAEFKGGTVIFDKTANLAGTVTFDKAANIGGTVIFDEAANIGGTINANKDSLISLHEGAKTAAADLILAGKMELIAADIAQITAKSAGRAALATSNNQPAQFTLKNVNLAGGTIDMSQSDAQLTMASLAGKGKFKLGTALNNHANAPLKVTGDAAGDFDIQIDASGTQPTNLNIIDIKGKNTARLALANGPVDLGNYKHSLVSDGKGGFKLVADKTALTPGTAGIMAVANTMPVIFNAELSSINNRLDKQTTAANESGVWLTYLNDSYDVKGTAANFNQKLNGVTLGGDKAIALGDAVLSLGGFASHTSSNIKSDYQSSGSVESNSLGAYAQLLSNSGYYFNSVLKTNQFKQNLSVTSQGNSATGAANFSGLGVALKAGKHINFDTMYVSPYVALNTFSSGKNQYKLSNGMEAQSKGTRSTTGTLGMNTGYRFVLNSGAEIKPYATFSVDHDLMSSSKVMINNEMFDNGLKGTRANAGVGVNVNLTSNLSIGSEVKLSKGKNIATPMNINLGVAYTF